jgi:hypothetical protein
VTQKTTTNFLKALPTNIWLTIASHSHHSLRSTWYLTLNAQKQVLLLRIKFLFNPTIEDAHVRMPSRLVHPRPERLMFRTKGSRIPRRNTRSFLLFNSKIDNGLTKPLTSLRDGSRPICAMATRVWLILWYAAPFI